MIRCLICEDDAESREKLLNLINGGGFIETIKVEVSCDGTALLAAIRSGVSYDILFLDIVLGEESGLEIAKEIRTFNQSLMIVITTSIIEYAMDGYAIKALDFLLKPIDPIQFERVVKRINKRLKSNKNHKHIFMKNGQKVVVDLNEVVYIESFGRKICLYYANGTREEFYQNLRELERRLNEELFFRCHRSYIINLTYVEKVNKKEVILKNKRTLPVSGGNHKILYDLYTRYMLEG